MQIFWQTEQVIDQSYQIFFVCKVVTNRHVWKIVHTCAVLEVCLFQVRATKETAPIEETWILQIC